MYLNELLISVDLSKSEGIIITQISVTNLYIRAHLVYLGEKS